jgi:hypothetical protein
MKKPIRTLSERSKAVIENNQDIFDWIREIQHSDQPEIDKLKAFFGRITTQIIEFAGKEIELAKAMQDRESLVKHQIKMETIKTAREIFGRGYQIATGKKAWDEQDQR